jgi:hypothetical protein
MNPLLLGGKLGLFKLVLDFAQLHFIPPFCAQQPTLTPIEFSHVAKVEVLVSWVLPDKISLPIINIAALTFMFLVILNV